MMYTCVIVMALWRTLLRNNKSEQSRVNTSECLLRFTSEPHLLARACMRLIRRRLPETWRTTSARHGRSDTCCKRRETAAARTAARTVSYVFLSVTFTGRNRSARDGKMRPEGTRGVRGARPHLRYSKHLHKEHISSVWSSIHDTWC